MGKKTWEKSSGRVGFQTIRPKKVSSFCWHVTHTRAPFFFLHFLNCPNDSIDNINRISYIEHASFPSDAGGKLATCRRAQTQLIFPDTADFFPSSSSGFFFLNIQKPSGDIRPFSIPLINFFFFSKKGTQRRLRPGFSDVDHSSRAKNTKAMCLCSLSHRSGRVDIARICCIFFIQRRPPKSRPRVIYFKRNSQLFIFLFFFWLFLFSSNFMPT